MIEKANFVEQDTPQNFGQLALTIPARSTLVDSGKKFTGRFWNVADIPDVHQGRWFVSSDKSRVFRLGKIFISNTLGERWIVKRQYAADGQNLLPAEVYTSTFDITDLPLLSDRHFSECNFVHRQPVDSGGGIMIGTRLFPAETTGITFDNCNLINCEPPPGSTVNGGNVAIIVYNVITASDTVTVDGEVITLDTHSNFVHGRYWNGAYEYRPTPEQVEAD